MKYLLEIIFAEFSGQYLKYTHNTCYLLKKIIIIIIIIINFNAILSLPLVIISPLSYIFIHAK